MGKDESSKETSLESLIEESALIFDKAKEETASIVLGQSEMINSFFVALLAGGHILLEGLPGVAKTLAAKTFAKTLSLDFKRIQFTADLLPQDLTGSSIFQMKDGTFSTRFGPVFTNILLADEINRAPQKVQAALLEVMQEQQVTIGDETHALTKPFLVVATQNPIDLEGTYSLPEAQVDRFMLKIPVEHPSFDKEKEIYKKISEERQEPKVQAHLSQEAIEGAKELVKQIHIDDAIYEYILHLIFATRYPKKYGLDIEGLLQFGASPRAGIHLALAAKASAFLKKRAYVTPEDVQKIGPFVLAHRLKRSYEAEAQNIDSDALAKRVFETVSMP